MTHIWQYQLKYGVAKNGIIIQNANNKGQDVYAYNILAGRKFKDYNMEQQGQILGDYFLMYHLAHSNSLEIKNALTATGRLHYQQYTQSYYLTLLSDFIREPKNATKNLPTNLSFTGSGCC